MFIAKYAKALFSSIKPSEAEIDKRKKEKMKE